MPETTLLATLETQSPWRKHSVSFKKNLLEHKFNLILFCQTLIFKHFVLTNFFANNKLWFDPALSVCLGGL